MSARYGIRRFALLNTAGYSLGLFPLEQPLSIYGANNLGKSASINALQFPILARLSDMSFGKYSTEQSKRFYFASDTSYILIEVLLPHGPHVIGVAGRGPGGGFGHQFFAYAGELDLAHYQRDGQSLRQRELFSQLDKNGIKAYELKPDELRRLLVGGHTQIPLDLTLIPLRSTSEQSLKTFRALFINLLHMREITASKLKQLFLDAFEHSLRSASVDYITACDEAFRDVRRMEQDFNALQQAASAIDALSQGAQHRDKLRGKLHALSPRIDDLVSQSHARFSAEQDELKARQAALSDEQQQLQETQREATQQLANLGGERQKISQWLAEFDSLQQRFSLVPHAEQLDQHLQTAKDQHDELAGALSQARHFSRADVDARAQDLEARLRELEKSLSLAANPLYSQLREHFSESEVDQLMRLFHSRLFDLPLDESGLLGESDWPQLLKPLLQGFDGTRFSWQGLRIDLSSIQPPALQSQAERQNLLDQQDRLQRELKQVHAQQQVMQNQEASQNALKGFYQQVMDAQNALEQFTHFQQLQPQHAEQCERQAQLDEQAANAQAQAERFAEQVQQLAQQHQQLQGQLNALAHRQQAITDALKRRPLLPSTLPAGSPWLEPISEEPEQLLPLIQDYADTWQQLQRVDAQIEALYAQVRLKGVAKFDGEADPERRIQLLLNAYQHRNEEALTLARARRAAVTDIARTLRNIRNDYDSLEHQLNLFNREINRRQVSNLESFRIVLAPHKEALQHIDHIIHSAQQYEKGETLSVFDLSQDSIDANQTDAARDYLAKMVAANQNQLGLRDLFELAFEITKRGGAPVLHTDIDGAASNGTTMTIKALTNMYLLLHLMDRDRAGKVRLPYYLDEAADIDEANQQALIETSALLGFTPILASVKPQVSARVAIDLEAGSGPEGIYLDEQDWKLIQPAPQAELAENSLS